MFTCLNANLYAIYIQFSRFLRNRRFAPKGFDPYIIILNFSFFTLPAGRRTSQARRAHESPRIQAEPGHLR